MAPIRGLPDQQAWRHLRFPRLTDTYGQIAQVAREMRLQDSSVGNWVREAREARPAQAPTAAERAEISELHAELEWVTRERRLGKSRRLLGVAPEERCERVVCHGPHPLAWPCA